MLASAAVLVALSSGHKVGLLVAAAIFIAFALASSFLLPRYRPDYPGARLGLFVLASLVLFVGMLTAVEVFGKEDEEAEAGHVEGGDVETSPATTQATTTPGKLTRVEVSGREFEFELPRKTFPAGSYEFHFKNVGSAPHNLVIEGKGVDKTATPVIDGGKDATLNVSLTEGSYKLYCAVAGHEDAGMVTEIQVSS